MVWPHLVCIGRWLACGRIQKSSWGLVSFPHQPANLAGHKRAATFCFQTAHWEHHAIASPHPASSVISIRRLNTIKLTKQNKTNKVLFFDDIPDGPLQPFMKFWYLLLTYVRQIIGSLRVAGRSVITFTPGGSKPKNTNSFLMVPLTN